MSSPVQTDIAVLSNHFPTLSDGQIDQFRKLIDVYTFWNEQINVISRKDIPNFYERHVLHSLGIAKTLAFLPGSNILDIGTGGGFPGIPLAILYPETHFTLVDSIGKKIKVVNAVCQELGLKNVDAVHERAENINSKFDFIISRAVTQMPDFIKWTKGKFKLTSVHDLPNGILYLKGGELSEELKTIHQRIIITELYPLFHSEFFETKKVVYVDMTSKS
jgi:16S rRNA (guanine527-N7)-methyltransferase